MKFVALISGGKDSFFNIMHCMKNGHELVALANLHPTDPAVAELDSFMFQTVGHDIIESYKQCVDDSITLFRRPISGTSANVSLEYEPTAEDEIEDLYELLKEVKAKHPDLEGVSCGAILSHYQRTRVENVCERLGLTSLAYLWQRDQTLLMQDMCSLGLDAILVKVAAVGLNELHLGKLIKDMYPILSKLNAMYDVHVCGEGGEFETLVLDAPFFQRKLQILEQKVISHSLDSLFLSLRVEVVDKSAILDFHVQIPPQLDATFQSIADDVQNLNVEEDSSSVQSDAPMFLLRPYIATVGNRIYYANIVSTLGTIESQMEDVLRKVGTFLRSQDSSYSDIQHVTLLLNNMENFAPLNKVYLSFFVGKYLPPSRVCVETTLPLPNMVLLSCVIATSDVPKSGIHIRSRSYWAPQNIGPYSQAILHTNHRMKLATFSGQIPLLPQSMLLNQEESLITQAVLSLQHLFKVKSLLGAKRLASCTCYITDSSLAKVVADIWKSYVDEVELGQDFYSRLIILQTTALPRGALIEWGGTGFERTVDMYDNDEEECDPHALISRTNAIKKFTSCIVPICEYFVLKLVGDSLADLIDFLRSPLLENNYVSVMTDVSTIHKLSNMGLSADFVPVLGVWDSDSSRHQYGMIWMS